MENYNVEEYYSHLAPETQEKPKAKKSGKVIFLLLVVLTVVAGIAIYAVNTSRYGSAGGGAKGVTDARPDIDTLKKDALTPGKDDGNNDLELKISDDKTNKSDAESIAEGSKDTVVGMSIYTSDGMLAGEGSCIILGENKAKTKTYVLTCAHMMDGEEEKGGYVYRVSDKNADEYTASLIGYDKSCDVAVFSIKKTGFKAAVFSRSSNVKSGESVISMGNPGGSEFYGSVTQGIVSSAERYITTDSGATKCIQHDSAINPGNSGGALFNMYGQVIGMNNSKFEAYEGMGFAIPSDILIEKVNGIIKDGTKTTGAKIGIEYYMSASYVNDNGKQLVVANVEKESDFYGKIKKGDFIIAVNGEEVKDQYTPIAIISHLSPGDEITLSVARKNADTGKYEVSEITAKLIEK